MQIIWQVHYGNDANGDDLSEYFVTETEAQKFYKQLKEDLELLDVSGAFLYKPIARKSIDDKFDYIKTEHLVELLNDVDLSWAD